MESGTVTGFSTKWRRFVVKDGAGKFFAFELQAAGKVKRGDAVQWERAAGGKSRMVVTNTTSNESLEVSALAFGVSRAFAEAFLIA